VLVNSGPSTAKHRWQRREVGCATALPDFGSRVLSASAVVAYVAVGAAAMDVAHDALGVGPIV